MDDHRLIFLDDYPAERDMIGRIILAYGQLEASILDALKASLGGETLTAMRTLYRLRSEANRLDIADALVRPTMAKQGIGELWKDAYDACGFCKSVRNQYAHCQWLSSNGHLLFASFDIVAKSPELAKMKFVPILLKTLQAQYQYFGHATHLVSYATDQLRLKTGQQRLIEGEIRKPPSVPLPSKDSRNMKFARRHLKIDFYPPQKAPPP